MLDELKTKQNLTRSDITELLKSIGKPGQKRTEKEEAVKSLELSNSQNVGVHETLESYSEF
jgi:hypothetical protein